MGIWMIVFSGSVPLGALWTGRAAVPLGRHARHGPLGPGLCRSSSLLVLASGVLKRDMTDRVPVLSDGRDGARLAGLTDSRAGA